MNYKANKIINEEKQLFGFTLRTRKHYHDDNIIRHILGSNGENYKIPVNPKVVIDIGANIGCVSLLAAARGAQVYAFEPEQLNFETLCFNVTVNKFNNNIKCIQKGVGIPGETKLYIHDNNSGATSSYLEQKGLLESNYQLVNFISIHDVFSKYNINSCDLLKLDCEGSEKDIINDLDDELVAKINQISLEFHDKKLINILVDKLKQWYNPENVSRYEWVFTKKICVT
jgi:FkbM family methyltransferase